MSDVDTVHSQNPGAAAEGTGSSTSLRLSTLAQRRLDFLVREALEGQSDGEVGGLLVGPRVAAGQTAIAVSEVIPVAVERRGAYRPSTKDRVAFAEVLARYPADASSQVVGYYRSNQNGALAPRREDRDMLAWLFQGGDGWLMLLAGSKTERTIAKIYAGRGNESLRLSQGLMVPQVPAPIVPGLGPVAGPREPEPVRAVVEQAPARVAVAADRGRLRGKEIWILVGVLALVAVGFGLGRWTTLVGPSPVVGGMPESRFVAPAQTKPVAPPVPEYEFATPLGGGAASEKVPVGRTVVPPAVPAAAKPVAGAAVVEAPPDLRSQAGASAVPGSGGIPDVAFPGSNPPSVNQPSVNQASPVPVVPMEPEVAGEKVSFTAAVPTKRVGPAVPPNARVLLKDTGGVRVKVKVWVDAEGKVTGAVPMDAETGAEKLLAPHAAQAALMWRFSPALRNGAAVASETVVVFQFGQ